MKFATRISLVVIVLYLCAAIFSYVFFGKSKHFGVINGTLSISCPIVLICLAIHFKNLNARHNNKICRYCAYDLRGIESEKIVCPECGIPFDPLEPLF